MTQGRRHAWMGLVAAVVGVLAATLASAGTASAAGFSLRFHGTGAGDVDRVKIRIDDPATRLPGPPADVGATDFTIEFWMRAFAAENPAPAVACGRNLNWIYGHVVVDRDRFNAPRKFGVSLAGGVVVFGVTGAGGGSRTICGRTPVLDGQWHHVAVQRRRADGFMWLYVDGVLEAKANGPGGNVSYPDAAKPGDFCGGPCVNSDPFLVLGAEKHDAGPQFPSYGGWLDEVRLSTVLRYPGPFTRPSRPFAPDAATAALYHFDEGAGDTIGDSSGAAGGPSHGVRRFGGAPAGPEWSTEVPPLAAPALALQPIATGLARPVALARAGDGSGRLFVVLQGGQILVHDGAGLRPTPLLDLGALVSCCGERGLLSAAFPPDHATSGRFYVFYTDAGGQLVVARYRVSAADPNVADPGSAEILLAIPHPGYANHNGGQLQFGPDGALYVGTGDGGGAGDPGDNAQNPVSRLGKILRLDVSGAGAVTPVIWALGLRNPWRFAFDRLTGDLFIADVGQGSWEEINLQPAGAPAGRNYGWRLMEGTVCYLPASGCDDGTPVLTPPILVYGHTDGNCSVTGGHRYRGAAIGPLHGVYLYGDYCSGRVWGASTDGSGRWTSTELLDTALRISTFGEDEAGELYVAHHDATSGAIYRLVPAP